MRSWLIITWCGVVVTSGWYPVAGQAGPARCPPCGIEVRLHTSLGALSDEVTPGPESAVVRVAGGSFFVGPLQGVGSSIAVYDSTGAYRGLVGGAGDGPGEFRRIRLLAASGDTIFVASAGRLTALTASGELVGTAPMPFEAFQLLPLGGDAVVVAGRDRSPSSFGLPFHRVELSRGKVTSFGPDWSGVRDPRQALEAVRWISSASDSSFWSAQPTRLEFELWSVNGERLRSTTIDTDWFVYEPDLIKRGLAWETRPLPSVASIHFDTASGLLWVSVRMPDRNWQPLDYTPEGLEEVDLMMEDFLDTRLMVIDPGKGQVVASRDLDVIGVGFIDGRLVVPRPGQFGEFRLDLLDLALVPAPPTVRR